MGEQGCAAGLKDFPRAFVLNKCHDQKPVRIDLVHLPAKCDPAVAAVHFVIVMEMIALELAVSDRLAGAKPPPVAIGRETWRE